MSEYALAFNDPEARKVALPLFLLIDGAAHDDENGGYHEAFSRTWEPLPSDTTLGPACLEVIGRLRKGR